MFKWIGDVLKKVLINLITLAVVGGVLYFLVIRYIF